MALTWYCHHKQQTNGDCGYCRPVDYYAEPIAFCDLPHPIRFAFLDCLSDISGRNGAVFHYTGQGITIAVPRDRFSDCEQLARRFGLAHKNLYYFPLGSDNPPEHMRHDSPSYPGSRGFWLYAHYAPIAEVAA